MAVSANRLELLQIADAVAREKSIDKEIVLAAMADAQSRLDALQVAGQEPGRLFPDSRKRRFSSSDRLGGRALLGRTGCKGQESGRGDAGEYLVIVHGVTS